MTMQRADDSALLGDLAHGFDSLIIDTGRLRQHVVIGGSGPALLLINGWPQTWYAWRLMLPTLAEHFTVVAAEPRGMGLSDKPASGYDIGTMAADLTVLMGRLGHSAYGVLGHDVGMWIGYAMAADHPEAVDRLAVAEAVIPGVSADPALFGPGAASEKLYHFMFNRLDTLNEQLVRGRERLYFGHQFTTKTAAGKRLEEHAIAHYVAANTDDPAALSAGFGPYRALDETIAQNRSRRGTALRLPVLAIGGAESVGAAVGATMQQAADDVAVLVIDGCGHFPAEESPEAMLEAVVPFFG